MIITLRRTSFSDLQNQHAGVCFVVDAIEDFTKTISLSLDYALAYNQWGRAYNIVGQIDQAIDDYNQAIQIDPEYTEAYANRGIANAMKGDTPESIKDLEKSLELSDDPVFRDKIKKVLDELK
ncbi:tetratricopeptide repeat protein [Candidatus Omnitrophota bacterium]